MDKNTKPKYWVTMTDNYRIALGQDENKINKIVMECDSFNEALKVRDNISDNSQLKRINIRSTLPHYSKRTHNTIYKTKEDYPEWYK